MPELSVSRILVSTLHWQALAKAGKEFWEM